MLGTMWSRNYTGEAETFVLWSQGGVEICLFLLDQTARMETKKVETKKKILTHPVLTYRTKLFKTNRMI